MTGTTLPPSAGNFRNGVAIVAGGSGGLGSAICRVLAAGGNDVALTYNSNRSRAEQTAREIEKCGRRSMIAQVDLVNEETVGRFVADVKADFGAPGTVVYAAGPYLHMRYISQLKPEMFRKTMEADVFGCFNLIHATLPLLRETRGVMVALATPALRQYTVKDILSIAPKAAILSLIRGIAAEEGRYGVRANCVGVGLVGDAGLFSALKERGDIDDRFLQATYEWVALHRLGRAEEIAEVVAFLASEKASFVTGQIVMADGGLAI